MTRFSKLTALCVLLTFDLQLGFSASYGGTAQGGATYGGVQVKPAVYAGIEYIPVSDSGTVFEGVVYEGICITNVMYSECILTGNEVASDFFLDSVAENFQVDWKKVIRQFAIGASVIIITGIAWFLTGEYAPVLVAIPKSCFKGAALETVKFSAMEAAFRGMLATLSGKPKSCVFKESIEGAANGFMWGSVFGLGTGFLQGTQKVLQATNAQLAEILAKGPLRLKKGEIRSLRENPGTITGMIQKYTGKSAKDGVLEFFIRLARENPKLVEELGTNPKIYEKVKDFIRAGHGGYNHEWLMAKNFFDFLTNPKWGNDGYKLATVLTELVQRTDNVVLKSGAAHVDGLTSWHDGLSGVISGCNNYKQVMNGVYGYAKRTLRPDSFADFARIFAQL